MAAGSCALPDDFVKGSAAAGGGGAGGSGPTCPPHPRDLPTECDPARIDDRHNCCFEGRDCGPDGETNCIAGECGFLGPWGPAGMDPEGPLGIVVRGDDAIFTLRQLDPSFQGRIMSVPLAGGDPVELTEDVLWTPTHVATDGSQIFWLNEHNSELWVLDTQGESLLVASGPGGSMAGLSHLAVSSGRVFFALSSGGIYRAGVDDREVTAAQIAQAVAPIGVAVAGDALFFTEFTANRVLRVSTDGPVDQEPMVIAEGADAGVNPGTLIYSQGMLYWITRNDIRSAEDDGDSPQVVVPAAAIGCTECVTGLHVDERYVYFAQWDNSTATGSYYRVQRFPDV
jgi:hypothetical protein